MPNNIEFFIHGTERQSAICQIPVDWENKWHHLAGIYNGKEMRLYVDGQLLATHPYGGKIMDSPFPVTIGRDSENHHSETTGMLSNAIIDQVRIYPKAIPFDSLSVLNPENAVLYLDFENIEEQGNFYMTGLEGRTYGLIWADRTAQPEMWQVKKSAQPVQVEAISLIDGKVKITNWFDFTNLNELDVKYNVGGVDAEMDKTLQIELPPHQSKIIEIPMVGIDLEKDQDLWINISFQTKESTKWCEKGHEIAWEQFQIRKQLLNIHPELAIYRQISLEETQDVLIIKGNEFEYAFDKHTGRFSRMNFNGTEVLESGPLFNVWRAPLANDIDAWSNWQHRTQETIDGQGRSRDNHWRTMGIDHLQYQLDDFEYTPQGETDVVIRINETALTSTKKGGFSNEYVYRINAKGEIKMHVKTIAQGKMPEWLPRLGLQFQLPLAFQNVAWLGRGPQENYPDRKTGYRFGNYQSTVDEMYVPYLIPQDNGNRSDVSLVKMTNDAGLGLIIEGDNFNFSAQNYSTDHMERAMYPFQLKKADRVFLNIDHKVNGLGDTSQSTMREYRVLPGNYEFSITIKPVK